LDQLSSARVSGEWLARDGSCRRGVRVLRIMIRPPGCEPLRPRGRHVCRQAARGKARFSQGQRRPAPAQRTGAVM